MVGDRFVSTKRRAVAQGLAVTVVVDDDVVVLALDGELDHASREKLKNVVVGVLATGVDSMVIDLTNMTFLDSAGRAVLAELVRYTGDRGGTLTIRNPSVAVHRLLAITGFDWLVARN